MQLSVITCLICLHVAQTSTCCECAPNVHSAILATDRSAGPTDDDGMMYQNIYVEISEDDVSQFITNVVGLLYWHMKDEPVWIPQKTRTLQSRSFLVAHTGPAEQRAHKATLAIVQSRYRWSNMSSDTMQTTQPSFYCLATMSFRTSAAVWYSQ